LTRTHPITSFFLRRREYILQQVSIRFSHINYLRYMRFVNSIREVFRIQLRHGKRKTTGAPGRLDKSVCPDAYATFVTPRSRKRPCWPLLSPCPLISLFATTSLDAHAPTAHSPGPPYLWVGGTRESARGRACPVHKILGAMRTPTGGPRIAAAHPLVPRPCPHDALSLKHETLGCNIRLKQMKHLEHIIATCV
jgi:hypothetical protein